MADAARQLHTQQTHYFRKRVNFNDSGIAGGVPLGTIPAGALIVSQTVDVPTAFNAGTTNALNVGTTATGTEVFTDAATAGRRQPTIAALRFANDTVLYASYASSGTAASAGIADIIIGYVPNNDK